MKRGIKRTILDVWQRIKDLFAQLLAVLFLGALASLMLFIIGALLILGNPLVSAIVILGAAVLFAFLLTRPLRKRLRFQRKLKKLCREKKYRAVFHRPLRESFSWSTDKLDFTLSTAKHVYYVHYLTVKSYRSSITLLDGENLLLTKYPPQNKLALIFNLKAKQKNYKVSFPKSSSIGERKFVNTVIVNPTCMEMFAKNRDGVTEPTGNGTHIFGYSVYTASGFIEAVLRSE